MGQGQFQQGLSTTESEGLQRYRSLSGLAVLALLLGLLSVTALAHPAAWIIPLAAVVCGLIAGRRIATRSDTLMGASLANLGLILGLFFLSWAPVSFFTDRWLIHREARRFGQEWLAAVFQGDLSRAYQATLPVRERQPEGTSLGEYYENNPLPRAERDAYFNDGIPRQLASLGSEGDFVFEQLLEVSHTPAYILTLPRFHIYRRGQDEPLLYLQMELLRERDADGIYWQLIRLADAHEIDHERQIYRRHRQPSVMP
jgi:hypothetical protein